MGQVWHTHEVSVDGDVVVKRYPAGKADEHVREWRTLRLLHAYAPQLAPVPLGARLGDRPPSVVMSRVPGEPLRGTVVTPERATALAESVRALHERVPRRVAGALPWRRGHQDEVVSILRHWNAHRSPAAAEPPVARALDAGMAWLRTRPFTDPDGWPPVLGPGDGNLANYLWDGARVRVVDFEDAGRSDRAFELAEITEHVAAWVDTVFDAAAFLDLFELTAGERIRLRQCRRLVALCWLFLLSYDDPGSPRNPPGTVGRQAARMMALL